MTPTSIKWDKAAKKLDADPAATVALDRRAWESLGAVFVETDDGNGETPGFATATVQTADGPTRVGVVDYGEKSTYLLVPGSGPERLASTTAVLGILDAAGALSLESDLLALADVKPAKTLDDLIADAKRRFSEELEQLYVYARTTTKKRAGQSADSDPTGKLVVLEIKPKTSRRTPKAGTVKWFSDDKGFGFITPDDGDKDLFVHHTGITAKSYEALKKGARVTFEPRDVDDVDVVVVTHPKGSRKLRPRQTTPGRRASRKS